MIGYLSGLIVEKSAEMVVLNVGGVGYEIEVPASTLCLLPEISQKVELFIHTHVREDALRLFGFMQKFDKLIFQELISVSGVGPKAALCLMGPLDGSEIADIILVGQSAKLTAIPGIGPKTAERLILELKTKLQKLLKQKLTKKDLFSSRQSQVIDDLKSALSNLGYRDKQYADVLSHMEKRIESGEVVPLEVALRDSLRKLSEHILQHR
ncbi:MAG: Holliday junction branch migration protein RuvA [Silvanigrellaceae bacterium]|nr:Holliday junction branch migration protein RuvA [Silvanigrellaceae bacterium]